MKKPLALLVLALAALTFGAIPATAATGSSLRATGAISVVTAGSLTITTVDGQAMSFRLVATTSFVEDGQAVAASVLVVGEVVRVKYHVEADGSLKAKEVRVESGSGALSAPVRVSGVLVSVSPGSIVVRTDAGQVLTLRLSPTTSFETGGRPVMVGGLRAGERVKVKYHLEADGSLKAKKVTIELAQRVSFQLEGMLIAAGARSLRVRVSGLRESGALVRAAAGRTITLTLSGTTIVVESGRKIGPALLARGDRVHASGVVSAAVFAVERVVARRVGSRR